LDLVTVEDWGEDIFAKGVGVKWKNFKCPTPTPPLHQPSNGQASHYNPRWWHPKPDLSTVLLQNNAWTTGYLSYWSR